MSIQSIVLFVICMVLAVLAFRGPAPIAPAAGAACVTGILLFAGGIVRNGIRRPVV
jgi:CHASE2 domain-containing sensor protein